MNYQRILEALQQELMCVNRALAFLTKAGSGTMASNEEYAGDPRLDAEVAEVAKSMGVAAKARAAEREPMIAELREEKTLLMRAIDTIAKLDERAGY